jgi:hypothetical protein
VTPEERVRLVAQRYDGEDDEARLLEEATLRRLLWRLRRGGKECGVCREVKPLTAYGMDSRERDGRRRECRECRRIAPRLA